MRTSLRFPRRLPPVRRLKIETVLVLGLVGLLALTGGVLLFAAQNHNQRLAAAVLSAERDAFYLERLTHAALGLKQAAGREPWLAELGAALSAWEGDFKELERAVLEATPEAEALISELDAHAKALREAVRGLMKETSLTGVDPGVTRDQLAAVAVAGESLNAGLARLFQLLDQETKKALALARIIALALLFAVLLALFFGGVFVFRPTIRGLHEAWGEQCRTVDVLEEEVKRRMESEEALRRKSREAALRARVLGAVLGTWDVEGRLKAMLEEAMALLGAEVGCAYLVQGDRAVLRAAQGVPDGFPARAGAFPCDEPPAWLSPPQATRNHSGVGKSLPGFAELAEVRVHVSLPLRLEQQWLGTLVFGSRRRERIEAEGLKVLKGMAEFLALVVNHVLGHEEARMRLIRLQALRDVDRAIISHRSIREIVRQVLEYVPRELGAEAVALTLLEESQGRQTLFAMRLPNGTVVEEKVFELARSLHHWLVVRKEPVVIPDLSQDRRLRLHRPLIWEHGLISYLAVPLVSRDEAIGILHLLTTEPRIFSQEDVDFFRTLAGQITIALENARLFQKVSQEARTSAALLRLERILGKARGSQEVCQMAVGLVPDLLAGAHGYLLLWDEEHLCLRPAAVPPELSARLREDFLCQKAPEERCPALAEVLRTRQPFVVRDAEADPHMCGEIAHTLGVRSIMFAPLVAEEKLLGVLCVYRAKPGAFSGRDLELTTGIAQRIAQAIAGERAREAERRQLQRIALLNELTRAALEQTGLEDLLRAVLAQLEGDLDVDYAAAFLHDQGTGVLTLLSSGGEAGQDKATSLEVSGDPILTRCVGGYVVYIADVDEHEARSAEWLSRHGSRSGLFIPLRVGEETLGGLVLARGEPDAFDGQDEIGFFQQLGEHVALAAYQAKLYQELEEAYEELRETQRQMLRQERLRLVGQIASGVAHDINNALSPVLGYADLLLASERDLSDKTRKYLKRIKQAGESIADTVERLRRLYRPSERQEVAQLVDLNRVVKEALDLTRPRWRDGALVRGLEIIVRLDLSPGEVPVRGDPGELRDAVVNLIVNALDAMPQGGTLSIHTSVVGEEVCVEVMDTGVGMDEATLARALEPFFTTKGTEGTGLGLSVVDRIVHRHGGRLELASELGQGTTVCLWFPRAMGSAVELSALGAPTVPPLRLLVVDDDPRLRQLLEELLGADGHTITPVSYTHLTLPTKA